MTNSTNFYLSLNLVKLRSSCTNGTSLSPPPKPLSALPNYKHQSRTCNVCTYSNELAESLYLLDYLLFTTFLTSVVHWDTISWMKWYLTLMRSVFSWYIRLLIKCMASWLSQNTTISVSSCCKQTSGTKPFNQNSFLYCLCPYYILYLYSIQSNYRL